MESIEVRTSVDRPVTTTSSTFDASGPAVSGEVGLAGAGCGTAGGDCGADWADAGPVMQRPAPARRKILNDFTRASSNSPTGEIASNPKSHDCKSGNSYFSFTDIIRTYISAL